MTKLAYSALAAVLVATLLSSQLAYAQPPLTVATDRSTYTVGDKVMVAGSAPANALVDVQILLGNLTVARDAPRSDGGGRYLTSFNTAGWKVGNYTVVASVEQFKASATFKLVSIEVEKPKTTQTYLFTYSASAPAKINFFFPYTTDVKPSVKPMGTSLYRVSYSPTAVAVELQDVDIYQVSFNITYPSSVVGKVSWAVFSGSGGAPSGADEFPINGTSFQFTFRVILQLAPQYPSEEEIAKTVVAHLGGELQQQRESLLKIAEELKVDRANAYTFSIAAFAASSAIFIYIVKAYSRESGASYIPPLEFEKKPSKPDGGGEKTANSKYAAYKAKMRRRRLARLLYASAAAVAVFSAAVFAVERLPIPQIAHAAVLISSVVVAALIVVLAAFWR
jgi:hypothetical protein